MKRLLLALLVLPSLAFGQLSSPKANEATQNSIFNGMATFQRGLILPIQDTALINQLYTFAFWPTARKEGAIGWSGNILMVYRNGAWQTVGSGSGGSGESDGNNYPLSLSFNTADGTLSQQRAGLSTLTTSLNGRFALLAHTHSLNDVTGLLDSLAARQNNYLTSVSFNNGALTFQRQGLPNLSVNLDGRYAPVIHTHTVADVAQLQQKLDDLQAQISGGGTAYTGSNGVQVNGTAISLTDERYTSAEKTKLAGIAPNATANSSDATLLNRVNHTGTQPISSVANLQQTLDGKVNYTDSNAKYVTPSTLTQQYYNKAQSDSRYKQTETDPVWTAAQPNYSTTSQANSLYAPKNDPYVLGSVDFAQIPVGTGTGTVAGSNTFTRIGGMVTNYGPFYIADSSKGYGFNVPNSDSTVYLRVDPSGNFIRQYVDGGTGDTGSGPALGVDPSQIVTLTGNQTVSNKTFTSPQINNPTGIVINDIAGLNAALSGKEPTITPIGITGRYWTGFKTWGVLNTDSVVEGVNNLYFTTARDNSNFDTRLATKTTSNLAEGTNLYYTPARARTAVSATGPGLSYNSSTGVFTSTALTSESDPVFTASGAFGITAQNRTDWTTAYNKRVTALSVTGTTTKTITATSGDGTTVTASFTDLQGSGGGTTIPSTNNVLKGDGAGNAVAATPGTDYVIPSGTVANATNAGTVTSIAGQVVAGTNMTRTGSGTTSDPYVFNSTASGGGGSIDTTGTPYSTVTGYQLDTAKQNIRSFNGVKRWGEIQAPMDAQNTLMVNGGLLGSAVSRNGTATGGIWNSNIDYSTIIKSTASIAHACATAANSNANVATQYPTVIRGNKLTGGGFEYMQDFAVSAFNSDSRLFVGVTASPGGSGMVGINPSGSFTDMIGFAKDAGDAFPSIMHNDNSGTAIKVPLTTQKAISTNAIYTVRISCGRNSTSCRVRVTERTWATGDVDLFNGTITSTTDLPRQTIGLAQFCGIGNATNTTSQIVLNFIRLRVETDY